MFTLTYSQLLAGQFKAAMQKLNNNTKLPRKTTYNLSRTTVVLERKLKEVNEELDALRTKFCKKDDAGNYMLTEDKKDFIFNEGVTSGDAKAAFAAFGEEVATIERNKFTLEELDGAELSAAELTTLEPLIIAPLEVE